MDHSSSRDLGSKEHSKLHHGLKDIRSIRSTRNQTLLRTLPLLILSLVLTLGWETMRPGSLTVLTPDSPKITQLRLGSDSGKTQALWAAEERLGGSGEHLVEDIQKATTKLETPDGSIRVLEEVSDDHHEYVELITVPSVSFESQLEFPMESKRNGSKDTEEVLDNVDPTRSLTSLSSSSESEAVSVVDPKSSGDGDAGLIDTDFKKELAEPEDRPVAAVEHQVSRGAAASTTHGAHGDVCDFSTGYWVKDDYRSFYSGKECKAYLSSAWACRQMSRPDYEYENLRWQPESCNMPRFNGEQFLKRLRNKVVAFVGDSLGRQQFQSLMCMITGGKNSMMVESPIREWGTGTSGYRFVKTNTTLLFHWSASLCDIEFGHPGEEEGFSAMHLDRPAKFFRDSLRLLDVVIINTGHHWNRGKLQKNKWHPYVDGRPVSDQRNSKLSGIGDAMNLTVHKVAQWLDAELELLSQKPHEKQPIVFMRTLSPRHFKNGDWDSGGSCDTTRPRYGPQVAVPVYKGPVTDRVAEFAVRNTRLRLFNITYLSQFREEAHISKYSLKGRESGHHDCLHWCLPGVPDVWNELLYGYLITDPALDGVSGKKLSTEHKNVHPSEGQEGLEELKLQM